MVRQTQKFAILCSRRDGVIKIVDTKWCLIRLNNSLNSNVKLVTKYNYNKSNKSGHRFRIFKYRKITTKSISVTN